MKTFFQLVFGIAAVVSLIDVIQLLAYKQSGSLFEQVIDNGLLFIFFMFSFLTLAVVDVKKVERS